MLGASLKTLPLVIEYDYLTLSNFIENGEWEMVLVEIQYPFLWNNVKKETDDTVDNWIIKFVGENWIPVILGIPLGQYNMIKELIGIVEETRVRERKQLIEHQIVGGSLVPLLRTVPIEGSFATEYR